MKKINEVIAENLIKLRKEHNLTQNEFAEKLNYSDNTVSRWERGEMTPSIETLEQISKIFNIELEKFIKEDGLEEQKNEDKKEDKIIFRKKLATLLLLVSQIWFIAVVTFFYVQTFANFNLWTIFVWAVPASCLLTLLLAFKWGGRIFLFVIASIFIWSFLASIYLQLLAYDLYLIFLIGAPAQLSLSVWTFLRKKDDKKTKKV